MQSQILCYNEVMLRVIERVKFMPRTCVGLVIITILSFVISGAHIAGTASADTTNINYNVSVAPALTLTTTTNSMVLNLDPSTKTFDSKNITVGVGTNNKTGYTLTLSTPQDSTDLVRDNSEDGVSGTMPTLAAGTYTQSTFTENKWGYKITSNTSIPGTVTTDYIPFTSGNTLMESDTAKNSDEASLTFAAKIDYLQASGSYSTTLNFHLVANPQVTYIQDVDDTICTTTPTTVVDKRDNQEYVIQKLADGRCWMMTNLNLGATDLTQDLTNADTNCATSGSTTCVATGMTGTPSLTAANFNSYKKTSGTATYTTPEYIPVTASNSADGLDTDPTSNTPYGTLYNYCVASAGTICASSSSSNVSYYDLCPAGWRLPTGDTSGEFQTLYNQTAYNTNAKMRAPIASGGAAFALAGLTYNSAPLHQGSEGDYWSSTISGTGSPVLLISTSNVNSANSSSRGYTFSMRCILKPQSMQSFTATQASAMSIGETKLLGDSRDNKTYTVAKLADGNVWMTENLNLAGGTTLSAADTDVTSEYISGFSTQGNLTKNANNTISLPASSTSGFNDNSTAYVYNSTKTGTDCSSPGCYGYYSWIAATLGGKQADGSTAEQRNGYNAAASICPKGWKLPSSTTSNAPATTSPNWKTGDFYRLATAYGANLESDYYQSSATFYNNAGPNNIVPNFLLAGVYDSGSFYDGGSNGIYWSSSSYSSTNAYNLYFNSSRVYSANNGRRYSGFAVRCLFNPGS